MKTQENLNLKNTEINKPVLAIETSGSLCGTAVYFSDIKYFEFNTELKNIHSEFLLKQIDILLKTTNTSLNEVKFIAVSSGPGSFTGLRIGMAAVKGLAFGLSIPVAPVPTFEAFAMQVSEYLKEGEVFSIISNVNREEVYAAKFQIKSNSYIFVENLKIIAKKNISDFCRGSLVFGNIRPEGMDNQFRYLSAPLPVYTAKWAVEKGADNIVKDIDYLEPYYVKNFKVRNSEND